MSCLYPELMDDMECTPVYGHLEGRHPSCMY